MRRTLYRLKKTHVSTKNDVMCISNIPLYVPTTCNFELRGDDVLNSLKGAKFNDLGKSRIEQSSKQVPEFELHAVTEEVHHVHLHLYGIKSVVAVAENLNDVHTTSILMGVQI